jgi:hypothetical protein
MLKGLLSVLFLFSWSFVFVQKPDITKVELKYVGDIWLRIKDENFKVDTAKAEIDVPLLTILPELGYS